MMEKWQIRIIIIFDDISSVISLNEEILLQLMGVGIFLLSKHSVVGERSIICLESQ